MNNNAEICEFIHHLFGTQDFVPLSAPKFIGNEKNTSTNVLIRLSCQVLVLLLTALSTIWLCTPVPSVP